jgi:hypothetical protein
MSTTANQHSTNEPTPPRIGPPLGNANRSRHGLRGSGLPKGCGHINRSTCHFRRMVEAEVLDARGEITLVDAACINTAFRAERHAQLAQRWLAKEADAMTPADRLSYSLAVVKASESRDKALAALNLPRRPDADPWQTLDQSNGHAEPSQADPTSEPMATSDAAAAHVEGNGDG